LDRRTPLQALPLRPAFFPPGWKPGSTAGRMPAATGRQGPAPLPLRGNLRIAGGDIFVQMRGMKALWLIVAGLSWVGNREARSADKVDFARDIQPILEKSCLECHGPEKPKGKLRLDSKAAALQGGQDGVVIVPGDAGQSDLYRRITLPADNDDVMPNKGDKLTKAQTDLIRDWINQGALWPDGVVLASVTPKEKKTKTAAAPEAPKLADYKPSAAELKAVAALESLGVAARPIAVNMNWRELNLRGQDSQILDKAFVPLKGVLGLVELNLAGTKIKDADLANLKGLTNLNRLHLENTPITDAGLVHLKGLVNLNYLNLYGTAVTDAGLKQLEGMTHLKNLYLWQTKTTEAGVADLKKTLPQVDISTGAELKVIAQKAEKKDEKEPEKK
jgi:mono/diheme cytochrome c family protein